MRMATSVVTAILWLVAVSLRVRGPQRKVIPQQLHDEGGVFVAVFIQRVQFSYGIVESLESRNISLRFLQDIWNIKNLREIGDSNVHI